MTLSLSHENLSELGSPRRGSAMQHPPTSLAIVPIDYLPGITEVSEGPTPLQTPQASRSVGSFLSEFTRRSNP
jgi:hypothetical protein